MPMIVSQASETAMQFVDRLFLSKVSISALSAALTGGFTTFVFQSFFVGFIGYITALVAQYYGAGNMERGLRTVSQGIFLSIAAYPLTLAIIPLGKVSFMLAGHSPVLIAQEYSYFSILMFGAIFSYIRTALSGYFVGIGKTRIVLIASMTGMLVNIPLNYILIFGEFGFPALGIRGAAIGTIAALCTMSAILLVAYLRDSNYIRHKVAETWRLSKPIIRLLLRFGLPGGVSLLLNSLAFNVGLQLFHSYNDGVGAAVTITFNYDAIAFIPMIGLGFATTSIVGRYMGAQDPQSAKKAGYTAWKLSLLYALGIMILFISAAKPLVAVFSSQFSELDGKYVLLAETMLRLASIYTLADMTQLVFISALRGAGDTSWVMKTTIILHWIYALLAIYFTRIMRVEAIYVWLLFILFIISMGITMFMRYSRGKWQTISVI